MKKIEILHKRNKSDIKKLIEKIVVFDCETQGLNATPEAFIFGCVIDNKEKHYFNDIEKMKNHLLSYKDKYIFAHNAEYDLSTLFGNIIKNLDNEAVFNGRFIMAKNGNSLFCDSFNIFLCSVEKLGESLGFPKMQIDEKLKSGKVKVITEQMIKYCFVDCEIVLRGLTELIRLTGTLKPTLSGFSMEFYRNSFQPYHIRFNRELCNEFFKSYFGGRTEAFKIGNTYAYCYDVNSSYPFAQKTARFPNPEKLRKVKRGGVKYILNKIKYCEGLCKVKVKHKNTYFGFLPLKHKVNKSEKLIFPVGTFTGCFNFNELRFALENGVIEIKRFYYAVFSDFSIESPFIKFIDYNFTKKSESTGIYPYLFKILMNANYGKWGQNEKAEMKYFENTPYEYLEKLDKEKIKYELHYFNPETRNDLYIAVFHKEPKISKNAIPLFSSYITSFSRIHLLKHILEFQKYGNIIYCDTDSIFIETLNEPDLIDSKELGGFKKESKLITKINGLKDYEYIDGGINKYKLKGVNKRAVKIAEKTYLSNTMIKTKEGLRQNKQSGKFIDRIKEIKHIYDKRIIIENGNTKPIEL